MSDIIGIGDLSQRLCADRPAPVGKTDNIALHITLTVSLSLFIQLQHVFRLLSVQIFLAIQNPEKIEDGALRLFHIAAPDNQLVAPLNDIRTESLPYLFRVVITASKDDRIILRILNFHSYLIRVCFTFPQIQSPFRVLYSQKSRVIFYILLYFLLLKTSNLS